jgi:hypothetical protein
MAALSSDPASMLVFSSSQTTGDASPSSQQERWSSQELSKEELYAPEPAAAEATSKVIEQPVRPLSQPIMSLPPTLKQSSSGMSLPEVSSYSVSDSVFKSFSSTPGYLANRWNAVSSSFSTPSSSLPQPMFTPPTYVSSSYEVG